MKTISLTTIIALVAIFFSFVSAAQEEPVSTEQSDDSLIFVLPQESNAELTLIVPPEGFEPTDKFNGYLHVQASSGIIMTMIENANHVKMDEGMTDDFFKANQLTLIERKDIKSDNLVSGTLYKCSFTTGETPFIRYIVFAGDLNKTLILHITYPSKIEGLVEPEILKSIQSITLNPTRDEK
ncbi:MAG: hypothetical protein ACI865_000480 [Flavobacteriaceae bacterium]|jgi:hypothetical protein